MVRCIMRVNLYIKNMKFYCIIYKVLIKILKYVGGIIVFLECCWRFIVIGGWGGDNSLKFSYICFWISVVI